MNYEYEKDRTADDIDGMGVKARHHAAGYISL